MSDGILIAGEDAVILTDGGNDRDLDLDREQLTASSITYIEDLSGHVRDLAHDLDEKDEDRAIRALDLLADAESALREIDGGIDS